MKTLSTVHMEQVIGGTTYRQLLCGGTLLATGPAAAVGYLAAGSVAGPIGTVAAGILLGVHYAMCIFN